MASALGGDAVEEFDFGDLNDSYTACREETVEAMKTLAGTAETGLSRLFPLIKIEIVRDAWQALGLLVSRLVVNLAQWSSETGSASFRRVAAWSAVVNIFAFDWGEFQYVTKEFIEAVRTAGYVITGLLALAALVGYTWFVQVAVYEQTDEKREGHEG